MLKLVASILIWAPSALAADAKILAFPARPPATPTATTESVSEPSCPEALAVITSAGRSNVLQSFPQIRELAERTDKTEYLRTIRQTMTLLEQTPSDHPGHASLWIPLLLNERIQNRISSSYGFTPEESAEIDLQLLAFAQHRPEDSSSIRILSDGLPDFLMGQAQNGRNTHEWRESWLLALIAIRKEINLDSPAWTLFQEKAQQAWNHSSFVRLRQEKQKARDRVRGARDERKQAREWLESLARMHQVLDLE